MKFKRAKGVSVFEAWLPDGPIRLDDKHPVLESGDPAVVALCLEHRAVVVDKGEPRPKKAAPAKAAEGAEA